MTIVKLFSLNDILVEGAVLTIVVSLELRVYYWHVLFDLNLPSDFCSWHFQIGERTGNFKRQPHRKRTKKITSRIDLIHEANYPIVFQKTWCVAKPSSSAATLLENINYACSQVDCRILQKGCPCSSPDNLINRASIAMNLYYQCKGRNKWNCDFKHSGLITVTNPSKSHFLFLLMFSE